MQSVQVSGRFISPVFGPVAGDIKFTPSKIWVIEDEIAYPTPAPHVELDEGEFCVELVRTDQHGVSWFYTVECPVGKWTIKITQNGPLFLKDLLPKRLSA
jgi:hypothetical protein